MVRQAVLIAALLLSAGARAQNYPPFTGWVIDCCGEIDGASRKKLNDLSESLDKASLSQLVVVLVREKDLGGLQRTEFANELFKQFKLGHGPDQNDGLLILIQVGEPGHRGLKVETGYDMEGMLPDGRVGWLIDIAAGSHMKKGEYAAAAVGLAEALAEDVRAAGPQRHGHRKAQIRRLTLHWGSIVAVLALLLGVAILAQDIRRRVIPGFAVAALTIVAFIAGFRAMFHEFTFFGGMAFLASMPLGIVWGLLQTKKCKKCGRWVAVQDTPLPNGEFLRKFECPGVATGACDYKGETTVVELSSPDTMAHSSSSSSSGKSESSGGGSGLREGGGGASGGGGADRQY